MANRATDDTAQDITASLVGGHDTVDDQESGRTDVIGNDAQRLGFKIRRAGRFGGRLDEMLKEVDLVIRMHALENRCEALEAHTGIDRRFRQGRHGPVGVAVVLHEDEVPDFDVPVAILFRRAGRPAPDVFAMVEKDFRAGATGAGITHGPEIVTLVAFSARLVADARESRRIDTDPVEPDLRGLVILFIDGDPELLARQAERVGQELPGVLDGIFLEIVAKAEVAEHFEKGVMPGRVADILEIIVLATGAHAALRRDSTVVGALFASGEDILELDHARVREQEGRIISRDERARFDHAVPALLEKVEESLSDFGAGFHREVKLLAKNSNGMRDGGECHAVSSGKIPCQDVPGRSVRAAGHRLKMCQPTQHEECGRTQSNR